MTHRINSGHVTIRRAILLLIGGLLASLPTLAFPASCTAHSGAERATVIELYTSEGCSSCPPAERWLSGFIGKTAAASTVIPLAFHVDYWDYIGWRDRFASPKYTARQYERINRTRGRFAYTPQTLINGLDSSGWRQAKAPGDMAPGAPAASGADLALRVETGTEGPIAVELDTKLLPANDKARVVAYLALYENGLTSNVRAGENTGRQLRHDFVVRDWVGPFPISDVQDTKINHVFTHADVVSGNSGVAALVELADGSRLLQAVSQPLCR